MQGGGYGHGGPNGRSLGAMRPAMISSQTPDCRGGVFATRRFPRPPDSPYAKIPPPVLFTIRKDSTPRLSAVFRAHRGVPRATNAPAHPIPPYAHTMLPPFPIFHFFATFALPKWIAVPKNESLVAKNRKASFLYELLDTYTAGLVLTGTEIKSLRMGKANLVDAYCLFLNGELWVRGLHIPEYSYGTHYNHNPDRERKLLLNRKELNKLERGVKAKGMTIVATRLFIGERGYAKLVIALARGKQAHDKRDTLKQRDADRELRQAKYRRR